jgi:hypothetical protein
VNLFSAIGDQDGFRHADFNVSPPKLGQLNGINTGTNEDIDVAWNDASYLVRLTQAAPYVQYSNDNGVNWAWMPSTGLSSSTGGNLAISADGTKIVYEQGGSAQVVYSTRSGSTWGNWTAPGSNRPADGAKLIADLSAAQTFYAYQNATVWRSADGGANWTVMTTAAPSGATWIRAVPGNAGHLLMARGGSGLWRSTNGGASWTRVATAAVTSANEVGVGAAAPGQSYPAIFVGGTVSGQNGFFRSDDQGATWTMISDLSHQYGDVTVIQGDPRIYGRLYVGANGRGVLYADLHPTALPFPAGWSTGDIGSPGSSGSAGQPSPGTWEVIGGGAGVGGTADQFHFAYQQLTGDGAITARVLDVPNHSPANNNAKAGVMIRASLAANSASAFAALTPGSVGGVTYQARGTTGGNTSTVASATTGVWPPYWIRLVRVGSTVTAYRSADGTNWVQLGSPQTIALGSTVYIGLASTASDNAQLNIAKLDNVTIVGAPRAGISPVAPDPRGDAVASLTITFDQPVTGFDLADLSLTRDGGAVDLAGATLSSADGGTTWTLAKTAAATGRVGSYTLTIAGSGITSTAGVPIAAGASESWAMNVLRGTAGVADPIHLLRNGSNTEYWRGEAFQYAFNAALLPALSVAGLDAQDTLALGGGVTARLAETSRLQSLSVAAGATLDVGDVSLVIDGGSLDELSSRIAQGRNGGAWNGSGICSSAAALDARGAIGIARAGDALHIAAAQTAAWQGHTVTGDSILVRYTFAGDADLNGRLDGDDYFLIDAHAGNSASPPAWSFGDFNYDTRIDGDDYFVLDANLSRQGVLP